MCSLLLPLVTDAAHQLHTGVEWLTALTAVGLVSYLAFFKPSSLWKCWYAVSPDPYKQPPMACVYIGVCMCQLNQPPSQIQPLYPIPCNPVGNVAAVNQFPFDQACSWLEFAQMCHPCGKTQAFSLTVQMFPDIVMFVDRKHLDV